MTELLSPVKACQDAIEHWEQQARRAKEEAMGHYRRHEASLAMEVHAQEMLDQWKSAKNLMITHPEVA
jgi:hypothetical protein